MRIFISHAGRDRDLVAGLAALLREEGHDVLIPNEMTAGTNLLSAISAGIRSADALIAVVATGNPTIFYELGVAAGAGVPTLVTSRAGDPLPADLAYVPYVQLIGDVLRDSQVIARRMKDLQGLSAPKARPFKSAEAALRAAVRNPALLESLSPSDFERLVAELFKERGYEVTDPGGSTDMRTDFAIRSGQDRALVLVEVKKLSRQGRVSVDTVRQLLGSVTAVGASSGVLVAPSGFTAAALALAAGSPILLFTLEELLAARSEKEWLESKRAIELRQVQGLLHRGFNVWFGTADIVLGSQDFSVIVRYIDELAVDDEKLGFLAHCAAYYGRHLARLARLSRENTTAVRSLVNCVARTSMRRPAWRAAAMLEHCSPDIVRAQVQTALASGVLDEERRRLLDEIVPEGGVVAYLRGLIDNPMLSDLARGKASEAVLQLNAEFALRDSHGVPS